MDDQSAGGIGSEMDTACIQDDVNAVKYLATPNTSWSKVLAIAAAEGAVQVATYCIQQRAKVDDNVLDEVICSYRSEPIYRFFLESGLTSVDYGIEWHGTMLAALSIDARQKSLIEYLLQKGADPNCLVHSQAWKSALACAAGFSSKGVVGLLLDYGARLNGSGALVLAAQRNQVDNVRFLLARGADVDEVGIENPHDERSFAKLGTSLHKAVEAGNSEIVEILLKAGANTELRDAQGRTAADIDKTRATSAMPL